MQHLSFHVFLVILLTLSLGFGQDYLQSLESLDGYLVSEAGQKFTLKLYQGTSESISDKNFIISPFSISSVLSMLWLGAGGKTRKELSEALGLSEFNDDTKFVANAYHDILMSLQDNKDSILRIANRVYMNNNDKLKFPYGSTLQSKYATKIVPVDFAKGSQIAEEINGWVNNATNGKISNIISLDSIEPNTKLMVLNVIYFKGKWVKDFHVKGTREDFFDLENGGKIKATFMEQEDVFPHVDLTKTLSSSAIAMPYEGGRYSLIVILPNEGVSLTEVENKLKDLSNLADIPGRMTKRSVQLVFPKFRMESDVDFMKLGVLQKIGINLAQTPQANFSQISDGPIRVDAIVQKCFIDITEYGTEAAGATHAKIVPFSIRRSIQFKVMRPFISYIYDNVTKSVLFIFKKTN